MAHPDRDFLIGRRLLLAAVPAFFAVPALARLGPELLSGSVAKFTLAKEPKPLPELAFTDAGDKPVTLAAYRGKTVLLNFWATWCGPCVREFPLLRRTLGQRRSDGLVVLGVLVNDSAGNARGFVREHGGTWTVGIDQGAKAAAAFKVIGLPETVFVRRDGTLSSRVLGELTQDRLDAQLAPVLAG
jgi:cytochrome c biogenesis protein CcmG/thiol:disulfide interchange protein DsbE